MTDWNKPNVDEDMDDEIFDDDLDDLDPDKQPPPAAVRAVDALTQTVVPPSFKDEDPAVPVIDNVPLGKTRFGEGPHDAPAEFKHVPDLPAKQDRWVCSGPGCGAVWKNDPGTAFHTHAVPVPGSKSRVTHENHPITKVGG